MQSVLSAVVVERNYCRPTQSQLSRCLQQVYVMYLQTDNDNADGDVDDRVCRVPLTKWLLTALQTTANDIHSYKCNSQWLKSDFRPHRSTPYVDAAAASCYRPSSVVCGLSVRVVSLANTAEPIEMPFGLRTRMGPRNCVLGGAAHGMLLPCQPRERQDEGCVYRMEGSQECVLLEDLGFKNGVDRRRLLKFLPTGCPQDTR